jgi:hypothetical protein
LSLGDNAVGKLKHKNHHEGDDGVHFSFLAKFVEAPCRSAIDARIAETLAIDSGASDMPRGDDHDIHLRPH